MVFAYLTIYKKLTTPEVFEFDLEDIKTRGYGLTMAEAMALHYWGDDANTADKQGLLWLFIGI